MENVNPTPETQPETVHAVPPVTGYRPLSDSDIDLMNRIKAKGVDLMILFDEINTRLQAKGNELWAEEQNLITLLRAAEQGSDPEALDRAHAALRDLQQRIGAFQRAEAPRWAAIGRSDIQQGIMALVRAVAQPDSLI